MVLVRVLGEEDLTPWCKRFLCMRRNCPTTSSTCSLLLIGWRNVWITGILHGRCCWNRGKVVIWSVFAGVGKRYLAIVVGGRCSRSGESKYIYEIRGKLWNEEMERLAAVVNVILHSMLKLFNFRGRACVEITRGLNNKAICSIVYRFRRWWWARQLIY